MLDGFRALCGVQSLGSIEERIMFAPASVSRRQFAVCITVAVVPCEIRRLDVGLAKKWCQKVSLGRRVVSIAKQWFVEGTRGEIPSLTEQLGREMICVGAVFPV